MHKGDARTCGCAFVDPHRSLDAIATSRGRDGPPDGASVGAPVPRVCPGLELRLCTRVSSAHTTAETGATRTICRRGPAGEQFALLTVKERAQSRHGYNLQISHVRRARQTTRAVRAREPAQLFPPRSTKQHERRNPPKYAVGMMLYGPPAATLFEETLRSQSAGFARPNGLSCTWRFTVSRAALLVRSRVRAPVRRG